jgi:hypothetical protein
LKFGEPVVENDTQSPFQAEIPSRARLLKTVLVSILIAALALVTIVLPAEYAIDPTGIGKALGLTEMSGAASTQGIELTDTLSGNDNIAALKAPDVGEPLPLPNTAVFQGAKEVAKTETLTVTLQPGGETEVKAVLTVNKAILYSWKTDGGLAYVDFHGHSPDWPDKQAFVRYLEAQDGTAADHGSLVAPFSGEHGWFWLNLDEKPINITLTVTGYYDAIKNYGKL